jgi:N-acetylglutamate synthase-like GNAT family acetyltransferase
MNIRIRLADYTDIDWINELYSKIGFQHAKVENEIIAIAETEDKRKIGVARLVSLDKDCLELAGVYVFESYRNKGVASKLIRFLMAYQKEGDVIYCIPFSKVKNLYKNFGFIDCKVTDNLPKSILDKCKWCEKSHKAIVDVLIFRTPKHS